MKFRRSLLLALAVGTLCPLTLAQPLTSSFTYQGELSDGGAPVNGAYDLTFRLFDATSGGTQFGPTLCSDDLTVTNGKFTVSLDFGNSFPGVRRFIEVQVRSGAAGDCANTSGYTTLLPRQEVTATPYATFAPTASIATSATSATNASNLNNQPASFYQNAANLTGTLADARLSANVPRLDVANTFATPVTAPTFVGTLSGNASTATLAANATNLGGQPASFYQNASNLNAGTLADARLSANVPRLSVSNTFASTVNVLGSTGLGTNAPEAQLHVLDGSAGTMTASASASAVFERNGNNYVQLFAPDANERGISFGSPASAFGGGIYYTNTGGMTLRAGGNTTRINVTPAGDVGIGTSTPAAKLDVNGTLRVNGIITTAPTAKRIVIPPTAFVAESNLPTSLYTISELGVSSDDPLRRFVAPVLIPDQARIIQLTVAYVDSLSSTDMTARLTRANYLLATTTTIATLTSSGNVNGVRTMTQAVNEVADANAGAYSIVVSGLEDGALTFETSLRAVIIEYETTTP